MSARRATQAQNVPSQSSYPAPAPQQSGYPQAYPQQQSGYPAQHPGYPAQHPPQGYPHPQQGYSQYPQQPQQAYAPQQGYPQQYAQQPQPYAQYPQHQHPQQHQAQYPSNYPQPGPQGYPHAQAPAPQTSQGSHHPAAYAATQAQPVYEPQIQYESGEPESGVHPADLDGRTIVRPTFTSKPAASLSPVPVPATATPAAAAGSERSELDRTIQVNGPSAHNDTVIAISPFADPFAIARLQTKSDPPPASPNTNVGHNATLMGNGSLAETRIQNVDPSLFAAAAPSPQPGVVGKHEQPYPQYPQVQPQVQQQHSSAYPQMQIQQAPVVHHQQQPAYNNPAISYVPAPAARTSQAPAARINTPAAAPAPSAAPSTAPAQKPAQSRTKSTPAVAGGGSLSVGMAGVGSVDLSKMNRFAGRFRNGMVPVFGLGAVLAALVFDAIFLKLPIGGGFISRLWYFTTFISFAAAGYSAAVTTRAGKGFLFTSAVVVAILYGAADIGLESTLGGSSLVGALILAGQGVVIAIIAGIFAMKKGLSQRAG